MSENDSVQVARVLKGDGDAYRALVDRHGRRVYQLAFRITGNQADAEDVSQESFMRAYKSLHLYDSRAQFSTWLYRIAANCALDLVRKRTRRMEADVTGSNSDENDRDILTQLPSASPETDRVVFSSQIRGHVESAMEELSPMERSAFVLRHFEGSSIEEICGALGVSQNAAKHCVFRAVQKLRRALEPVLGSVS
jgi:RNA polymerase sigma-70 factor (ECF subfamily)